MHENKNIYKKLKVNTFQFLAPPCINCFLRWLVECLNGYPPPNCWEI